MWFDTCAVASAPSLTFVVSVTFGSSAPSVTVALAVSWNKTSQLKLYNLLRGRPFNFWRRRDEGGGGNFMFILNVQFKMKEFRSLSKMAGLSEY